MTSLAPLLEAFFSDRLQRQRRASSHTVAAYRDAFRLLLAFAEKHNGKAPSVLLLADIDAPLVGAFLDHLERGRGNSVIVRRSAPGGSTVVELTPLARTDTQVLTLLETASFRDLNALRLDVEERTER